MSVGWGEARTRVSELGVGTSGQVEDAHKALDAVGVRSGKLALRVMEAVGLISRLQEREGA